MKFYFLNRYFLFGSILLCSSTLFAEQVKTSDFYKFSVNFIDLGMYSDESMVGDHTTNAASLVFNANLKLKSDNYNLGDINIQYYLNHVNEDSQLNTSTNWMGGVGSYIGGAIAGNDISPTQLSQVTWDKKWSDDLYTSLGRTNLRRHFLYNNCGNPVLCTDPIKAAMGSIPVTYGYWGGYLKYNLTDKIYFHTGLYEVNIDDYINKKHGLDFSTTKRLGETQVYSFGYQINEVNKIEALYFYNNSEYKNAYTKESYKGVDGFNVRFDYSLDTNKSPTLFGSYSYINEENQAYKNYWELGANYKLSGFFKNIGVKYGESLLNNDFVKQTELVNGNTHKNTSFVSVDTKFKYKKLSLSPFAQYIWNPDNFYQAKGEVLDRNLILGVFTQFQLY